MRIVAEPTQKPNVCCVIPGRGAGAERARGFIDTGNVLPGWDPHIYISVEGGEEVARFLGWSSPQDISEVKARLREAEGKVEDLEREVAELDTALQSIDNIESVGFTARKRTGRPPKPQEAAA